MCRFVSAVGSPVVNLSNPSTPNLAPALASSQTPGARYSDRTNRGQCRQPQLTSALVLFSSAGEVVVRHNCDGGQDWEAGGGGRLEVTEVRTVRAPYKFMFERMRDTAVALDETICRVADRLADKHQLAAEDMLDLGSTQAEPAVGVGRVQCDSEGRLNSNSVVLHGSLDTSSGVSLPVDLSQAPSFSLFPGQVVAMECHNPTGSRYDTNHPNADANTIFCPGWWRARCTRARCGRRRSADWSRGGR